MMQIIPVRTPNDIQQFLTLPIWINQGNPEFIRPLDKDIEEVFDAKKNKAFRHGTAERWLLLNENGKTIGRIAAFVNKKYKSKGDTIPVGGMGFFDCINDPKAAGLLLDTAKAWLQEKGMHAMDGPINFGERDKWWGLLVKGFQAPLYGMNYNPPYYKDLLEQYGFQVFFNQICFGMDPRAPLDPKFFRRHAELEKDNRFSARYMDKNHLEKYAIDFATVYNKAWSGHGGNKELSEAQCIKLFKTMKPIMDERIVWFCYYDDEPIGIFINLPDLNQWFKYLNGQFNWLAKLQFLWVKATKPNPRFTGLVFGIVPEWQGKGVDSYLIVEAAKIVQHKLPYTYYEMQWIGDFNPKMIAVASALTPIRSRQLTTYRYLFDRNTPFQRHPIL